MVTITRLHRTLTILTALAALLTVPGLAGADAAGRNHYRLAVGLGTQLIGEGGGSAPVVGGSYGRRVTRWLEVGALVEAAVGASFHDAGAHAFFGVGARLHPWPRLYLGIAAGGDDVWVTDRRRGDETVFAVRPALGAILYPGRHLDVGLEAGAAFSAFVGEQDDTFRDERLLWTLTLQLGWR